MKYSKNEILSIKKCINCLIPDCFAFGGAIGDKGESFGKHEIEELIKETHCDYCGNTLDKETTTHLENLLKNN